MLAAGGEMFATGALPLPLPLLLRQLVRAGGGRAGPTLYCGPEL